MPLIVSIETIKGIKKPAAFAAGLEIFFRSF